MILADMNTDYSPILTVDNRPPLLYVEVELNAVTINHLEEVPDEVLSVFLSGHGLIAAHNTYLNPSIALKCPRWRS